jgi:hypothetical protein
MAGPNDAGTAGAPPAPAPSGSGSPAPAGTPAPTTVPVAPGENGKSVAAAGPGVISANLRARPVDGVPFAYHLYIEYVNTSTNERLIFEAMPDYTKGVFVDGREQLYGYLHGMAPRPWGVAQADPEAPGSAPSAHEAEDNTYSRMTGVNARTKYLLEFWRRIYNTRHIVYDATGNNSNVWAVTVATGSGLEWPDGLPVWRGELPGIPWAHTFRANDEGML